MKPLLIALSALAWFSVIAMRFGPYEIGEPVSKPFQWLAYFVGDFNVMAMLLLLILFIPLFIIVRHSK